MFRRSAPRTVLLHQPGKVGSSSLAASFAATAPEVHTQHVHIISNPFLQFFRGLVELPSAAEIAPGLRPQLTHGLNARRLLDAARPGEVCVVCGVRDPYSRAVSAYFQSLLRFHPNLDLSKAGHEAALAEVIAGFEARFDGALAAEGGSDDALDLLAHWLLIGSSLHWFDLELKLPYGLAIEDTPLVKRDVCEVERGGIRFVLYRFEAFREVEAEIVERTFGRPATVRRANVSDRKPYGRLLKDFRSRYTPPPRIADLYREHPFSRRFYGSRMARALDRLERRGPRTRPMPLIWPGGA